MAQSEADGGQSHRIDQPVGHDQRPQVAPARGIDRGRDGADGEGIQDPRRSEIEVRQPKQDGLAEATDQQKKGGAFRPRP